MNQFITTNEMQFTNSNCELDIITFMNLVNINFNISTLICGYKYEDTDYLYVNQLLCIIYFTVYKISV